MAVTSTADLAALSATHSPDVPLFTLPVVSETLSSIAGIQIPIIGNITTGALATGILKSVSPTAAQVVSIATYVANLPLTLFKRPEGAILIGNLTANVLYNHYETRKNRILDGSYIGDPIELENSKTSPYIHEDGVTRNGGILTTNGTDFKKLFYNADDPRSRYSVLSYNAIQERAAASQKGIPLDDFRNGIPDLIGYPTENVDTKQVLKDYDFRSHLALTDVDPTLDDVVVDPMMADDAGNITDFIKLIFKDKRDPKDSTGLQFRSYITHFSDKFNPNWSDINYIGRPNPLKLFSSVARDIALEFIVPALSRGEMKYMYNKLSKLAKMTLPKGVGVMTAPIMEFTLGDWFENESCHITALTFDIDPEYSWEVNLEGTLVELPHVIKVSMGIFIIGNTVMETDSYSIFGTTATKKFK